MPSISSPPLSSITLISSPYHVGLHKSPSHRSRISEGPAYLIGASASTSSSEGLLPALRSLAPTIPIHMVEIPPVEDDFEGEIGRSFEILRRTSAAVSDARTGGSFPVVVAGNCCSSVGVMSGLSAAFALPAEGESEKEKEIGCIWFDAHDDYNVPDTVVSGYFDSQGIAMMAGESWKALVATIPGFKPVDLKKVVHVGMRDVNELERGRVKGSEMGVVWGGEGVDFVGGLEKELDRRLELGSEVLVHLDLDVLDVSVGKANAFACGGGLSEEDLRGCMRKIVERTVPLAFTVASFDPFCDSEESARRITAAAVDAVKIVVQRLQAKGLLVSSGAQRR
ncbi:hypothetical protein B0T16DRAFT_497131 [Cercophora newfieldiana]|uniref:Arginase n=1 Tax=Cercophora newfieldiana TaxID=92897 RepID=A0AA39XRL2_9PEZI|nr:hypothetical protein B0T16DRAFT_497131 [Cercophora newfieldiana]